MAETINRDTPEFMRDYLERNGFRRSVAGEDNFNQAVEAMLSMRKHRLGVLVSGGVGLGKTRFVDTITGHTANLRKFRMADPMSVQWLRMDGPMWWREKLRTSNIYLDDMGAEMAVCDFGVRRSVMPEFIDFYHVSGMGRLYITTNLDGQQMMERYGDRLVDRLKELCVPLKFTGKSRREWAR